MNLTTRQHSIIKAMKYLAIKNKNVHFRCYFNNYDKCWHYSIYEIDNHGIASYINEIVIKKDVDNNR